MASEVTLRQRVLETIAPWAESEEKPPFTVAEMVVMVLVLHGANMKEEDIFNSICRRFRFYQTMAFRALKHFGRSSRDPSNAIQTFQRCFAAALKTLEVPVTVNKDQYGTTYSISPAEARVFLADVTGDHERAGVFPFFDLPPELRKTIYELIFQYPRSGIALVPGDSYGDDFDSTSTSSRFAAMSRSFAKPESMFPGWHYELARRKSGQVVTMLTERIFAPLLVSWQFFEEALPCFFQINQLYVPYPYDLCELVYGLVSERRQYITGLSLDLTPISDPQSIRTIEKALSCLTGLKRLHVRMPEGMYISHGEQRGLSAVGSVAGIPWINVLRKIRGLTELTFTDCPGVEALVRDDMTKPKAPAPPDAGSKKRKAEAVHVAAGELRRSQRVEKQVKS